MGARLSLLQLFLAFAVVTARNDRDAQKLEKKMGKRLNDGGHQ
ncbi:MAG TPA: hypothetical protein VJ420_01790 [Candidatus Udaeobacter sp.]|nr:hypothetical protein [Candidatus Udaeobacter sp.]